MGKKNLKEAQSENEKDKNLFKTELATKQELPQTMDGPATEQYPVSTESLKVLQAMLDSHPGGQVDSWAQEVFQVVLRRFKRMPRGGWRLMCDVFNKKFNGMVTPEEMKILATKRNAPLKRGLGEENFLEGAESPKKEKLASFFPGIDNQLLLEVSREFKCQYELNKCTSIENRQRTKKVPAEKFDANMMKHIQLVLASHLKKCPPEDISDISLLIYTVQKTYETLKTKEIKASQWKYNILTKIDERIKESETLTQHMRNVQECKPKENPEVLDKIFRKYGIKKWDLNDCKKVHENLLTHVSIYKKKLEIHEKRKEFRKTNYLFELNRARFYRKVNECDTGSSTAPKEEVLNYWTQMWRALECEEIAWEEVLEQSREEISRDLIEVSMEHESLDRDIHDIISRLPNWKAAGIDCIFNFFIKESKCLHPYIVAEVRKIMINPDSAPEWLFTGITYLIPKKKGDTADDHRPITCMANLYKIFTKAVTAQLRRFCEINAIISENQLGTIRDCQGAKEQALINKIVNRANNNLLKTCWIDVKKAYDSVSHAYLMDCLESLHVPDSIRKVVSVLLKRWRVRLVYNQDSLCHTKIDKGILQGDSLSPLLFVLCLEPLSRLINSRCKKAGFEDAETSFKTNHLIFIDDIKLLASDEEELGKLSEITKKFLNGIGMEINPNKSASNSEACSDIAKVLEEHECYKYLGILEDRSSVITKETNEQIKDAIYQRTKRLCETKLNARNLFRAINEFAISKLNYYIGLVEFKQTELKEMDRNIRTILRGYRIHLQPANSERLYLKRDQLGRGLESMEMKAERILLEMNRKLSKRAEYCNRAHAIIQVEKQYGTQLAIISQYLKSKYNINNDQEITTKDLIEIQVQTLLNNIKNKEIHKKFMQAHEDHHVDVKPSAKWLKKGNNTPQSEGLYCYLQDRNIFFGQNKGKCNHCKSAEKSVDHLATKCGRMLHHDYLHRHNEVLKCIHLLMCNRYGLKLRKKLRVHKVEKFMENERASIKVDTPIMTDVKIQYNKPDIVVHDKVQNEIIIIEIGITSIDNLKTVEMEKTRKYDLLAKELGLIYKCTTRIIPYVFTWDGLVTKYHTGYKKMLGVEEHTEAYIQSLILKKTFESISIDFRRSEETVEYSAYRQYLQDAAERILKRIDRTPSEVEE